MEIEYSLSFVFSAANFYCLAIFDEYMNVFDEMIKLMLLQD